MVSKRSDGFITRESGAATFDWVILAVGVFGLALAVYSLIDSQRPDPPPAVQTEIAAPPPPLPEPVAELRGLSLLYPHFGEPWRAAQIAHHAGLDDAGLLAAYAAQYRAATGTVNARIAADYLAVIEAEMALRGLDRPPGNRPATDIHAGFARQ